MKSFFYFIPIAFLTLCVNAQNIQQSISAAYKRFENDSQLRHAISSLCIIDGHSGKLVFERNSRQGLVPASAQKVITSVAALELLGMDYRYKTEYGYDGEITKDSMLIGTFYISGQGDPSLGSWRFANTKKEFIEKYLVQALHKRNIYQFHGSVVGMTNNFESQNIPSGWIWEDVANYYGAGASALNWNENQYDVILKPGRTKGDSVKIVAVLPKLYTYFENELETGAKGSGDNAFIFFGTNEHNFLRGTVPCCVDSFVISGAVPDGNRFMLEQFGEMLKANQFTSDKLSIPYFFSTKPNNPRNVFHTHYSPTLDSLNYYFLKKSINLYGEAFIRTLAFEKAGFGSSGKGIEIIKSFWKQHGIDEASLQLMDGSGLSPLNRVTSASLVKILQYAKAQIWFPAFYQALPEINGIRMKSGSINGVRSYAGYVKSKSGAEYIFAFIVNNFDGHGVALVRKMWQVLDILK